MFLAELQNDFNFKQGQYLTFKDSKNDEEIRRSYSICSSPLDGELRVAVKKITDGIFSTYINNELKVGDALDVMTPQGNFFTEVNADHKKTICRDCGRIGNYTCTFDHENSLTIRTEQSICIDLRE
jgi:Flavodoxin reductases (ferredoxin-NADPH reductases) family 1